MTEVLTDQQTNIPMEVVEPGSPEDPFKGKGAGAPSASVSAEGTPQETPAPTGDGEPAASEAATVAPAAAPTETPAAPAPAQEAPVLPAHSGVVEVIPPTAPAAAVTPATVTPAEEAKPAEEAPAKVEPISEESAKVLKDAIQAQVEEALRGQQSTNDQRAAKLEKSAEQTRVENKTLTDQIRSLEMRDLTEEEQVKVQAVHAQADERESLNALRDELAEVNASLYVQSLMLDYEQYGVEKVQLEELKTPEEMDVFCLEAKATTLEKKLAEVPAVTAEVATASVAPAAIPQEPPKAETQAVAQVPAAAQVATDMGSPGAASAESKFSDETSPQALRENLKAAGWTTVRLRG